MPSCKSVVDHSPDLVAVASERRPVWAHRGMVLDGRVVELSESDLAFTTGEVGRLVASRRVAIGHSLADGWPIVVGLAAMTGRQIDGLSDIPGLALEELAVEISRRLGPEVCEAFVEVAHLLPADRSAIEEILGQERAVRLLRYCVGLGLIDEYGGKTRHAHLASATRHRFNKTVNLGCVRDGARRPNASRRLGRSLGVGSASRYGY